MNKNLTEMIFIMDRSGLMQNLVSDTIPQSSQWLKNGKVSLAGGVFMGANIDAISNASGMGIDASRAANYHADGAGTATNFMAVGKMFTSVRKGSGINDNWKDDIDKDYNSRK